jgi:hypothetical protein
MFIIIPLPQANTRTRSTRINTQCALSLSTTRCCHCQSQVRSHCYRCTSVGLRTLLFQVHLRNRHNTNGIRDEKVYTYF